MADYIERKDAIAAVTNITKDLKGLCLCGDKKSSTSLYLIIRALVDAIYRIPSSWTSVEDNPPPYSDYFLCKYEYRKDDGTIRRRGIPEVKYYNQAGNDPFFAGEGVYGMKVTHWMPLPNTSGDE